MKPAFVAIYAIWLREITVFFREKSRIFGMIGQPLLYLLIVGKGIASAMSLNAAPGGLDYMRFMYPGIIGMSILFTSMFSGMSIIWDRDFGFLKEVLVAPVPRWSVAVGKTLGGASVSLMQSLILVVLAPFIGIHLSVMIVIKLIVMAAVMSIAMTSLGVTVASRMTSMQGFQMVMNFLVMPLYFLSGAMFPITSAPLWMKTFMVIDPLTYGVDALRNVVFSGTALTLANGVTRSLEEIARQSGLVRWNLGVDAAVMLLVALVLTGIGATSFNKVT